MEIAQKIYNEAQRLPEFLAREVLDFIGIFSIPHSAIHNPQSEITSYVGTRSALDMRHFVSPKSAEATEVFCSAL